MTSDLDALVTEGRAGGTADHDLRPTLELVERMAAMDATVPAAVAAAAPAVAGAIDAIVERLERGGRLVYARAGTSGRVGAPDPWGGEATLSLPREQGAPIVARDGVPSPPQRDPAG